MSAPSTLGDFLLEREIGRGGMGVVYLARQLSLRRPVALKVLPHEFTSDPMRLSRFRREAEVISRLDHPSIVPVYAVGESQGVHFIAMKYLEGRTLDRLILGRRQGEGIDPEAPAASGGGETVVLQPATPSGMLPGSSPSVAAPPLRALPRSMAASQVSDPGWVFSCIRVVEKVARALEHAHERGVIHRDIKPSNILLQEGNPVLLDFGLVRDLSGDSLTESDSILGTAYYMAPEQIRRDHARTDHRVDVYSLGVTLYELVTLVRPFDYRSPDTLFHAIVNEEPVPPRRLNPKLPRDLETVILKAMRKDPDRRYGTALEFAEDLRRVRSFEPIVARPVTMLSRVRMWMLRNPAIAGAFLFAFLSFVGMVEYSIYRDLLDQRRAAVAVTLADTAYDSGRFDEAYHQYSIYLALGGDADVIAPRLNDILRRLGASAPPAVPVARR